MDERSRETRARAKLYVARSRVALERIELRIDSVAQDHLDVVQGLKGRSRDPRVPDVEGEGLLVLAAGLLKVGGKAGFGDPRGGLSWLHSRLESRKGRARLVGVCPR